MTEETEIPAVCETCLGPNPYVQMLREQRGAECKICTRPFTVFKWVPNKGGRYAKTVICLTCARQKNCCQSCMNDLTYGLPLAIRDAALKMAGSNSHSSNSANAVTLTTANNTVQKQFVAQNYEKGLKDGTIDAPENSMVTAEDSARELLENLSAAMKKNRTQNYQNPVKKQEDQAGSGALQQDVSRLVSKLPLNGSISPPKDESITSLFIAGIEEDVPEYRIREFLTQYGQIKSLVCVHRARAGYVTYKTRKEAEHLASSTREGRIVLNGCKLKLAWGKPRPLGTSYTEQAKVGAFVKKSLRKGKISKG